MMQDRADALGATVRARRLQLGLRQDELADLAACSTRFVHALEAGKDPARLDKVLDVLGVLGLGLVVARGLGRIEAEGTGASAVAGTGVSFDVHNVQLTAFELAGVDFAAQEVGVCRLHRSNSRRANSTCSSV